MPSLMPSMEKLTTITTLQSLLDLTATKYFAAPRGQWVFRGHANAEHPLVPSVGRTPHTSASCRKFEESIFSIFLREAPGYLSVQPKTEWEWLCFAQHHCLPTRLLDWTYNPLVALYFVVEKHDDIDGALFALRARKQAARDVRNGSPFAITEPVKYFPSIVTPRIRAQEGLFIACSDLESPLEKTIKNDWKMDRMVIPAKAKKELRYALFRVGTHASSLFPDVEGLATRLKWQHGVRSPFKGV